MKPGRVLRHDQERMLAAIRNSAHWFSFLFLFWSWAALAGPVEFVSIPETLGGGWICVLVSTDRGSDTAASVPLAAVLGSEISRAPDVFAPRPLNFKTPRHATASTTMLHFGVYVAVPRGTNTVFDSIRIGLLTGDFGLW
jgi:hypothetical protein